MLRIGLKCGKFQIYHAGHAYCLAFCKSRCDYLIILLNSDNYILRHKERIIASLDDRKAVLKSVRFVNEVNSFDEDTEDTWIAYFKKNDLYRRFGRDAKLVMFHSPEKHDNPPAEKLVDEIIFVPFLNKKTNSSNKILRKAKDRPNEVD